MCLKEKNIKEFAKKALESDDLQSFLRKHKDFWNSIKKDIDSSTNRSREKLFIILNGGRPKCKCCSNFVSWDHRKNKFKTYCSVACSNADKDKKEKIKQTNLERYGVEYPLQSKTILEKRKRTHVEKYGVEYPIQNKTIKEKIKQTNLKKYGETAPAKNEKIKEKIKETNLERYGVEWVSLNKNIKKKQIDTLMKNFNVSVPMHNEKICKKVKDKVNERFCINGKYDSQKHIDEYVLSLLNSEELLYKWNRIESRSISDIAKSLGVSHEAVRSRFIKFNIEVNKLPTSNGENELCRFLNDLNVSYITNTKKIIPPYELDIYIPEHNLAIEYNGLYWHSESGGKDQYYHLNKTILCEQKGIRLIHIFEDEWRDQQQKCKDTLRHLLGKSPKGIYARNMTIREISWNQAKEFLDKYHLLNSGTSGNYRIGAFDKDNNLIGVMVFGIRTGEGKDKSIELKRFVTDKRNHPGLGSKMFKYAVNKKGYDEVIAFVDRRWFTGLVKDHIGFERISYTKPSLWWTDYINRYHRRFKTKKQLLGYFNESLTKLEMMNKLGYYRIWDCGKIKLKWVKK